MYQSQLCNKLRLKQQNWMLNKAIMFQLCQKKLRKPISLYKNIINLKQEVNIFILSEEMSKDEKKTVRNSKKKLFRTRIKEKLKNK